MQAQELSGFRLELMHGKMVRGIKRDLNRLSNRLEERLGFSLGGEFTIGVYISLFLIWNLAGASFLSPSVWAPYTEANSAAAAGSAWIEGSSLRWADGSTEYWLDNTESTVVTTSPGGSEGSTWIEGSSLHWIDQNIDERMYTAPETGDSPGNSGAAWIENGYLHYIDTSGDERAAVLPWGDDFEDGDAAEWSGSNYYIKSDAARGTYSIGSDGQGSMDAEIIPGGWNGGIRPNQIRYQWWEESSQTGFTVDFIDSSGNYVLRAGGNNPQWELSDGSGSTTVYSGNGQYRDWTSYQFDFDWANCQYSYTFENTATGYSTSGTRNLDQCTSIEKIRLSNDNSNWGNAEYMRFDSFYAS